MKPLYLKHQDISFYHERHSCGILSCLIWVRLPVSQLQGDAREAVKSSLCRKPRNTSLIGGDDIC